MPPGFIAGLPVDERMLVSPRAFASLSMFCRYLPTILAVVFFGILVKITFVCDYFASERGVADRREEVWWSRPREPTSWGIGAPAQ